MTCTPQELAAAAACYRCLPDGMIRSIRTSLICQWANQIGCGEPTDCLQIAGSTNPAQDGIYFKSSDVLWMQGTTKNQIEFGGGVWQMFSVTLHVLFFTLDSGEFPCGHWTPGAINPGASLGTIVFVECPNYVLQDANGFFWRIIIDVGGLLGTQPDSGPATPDIILDDGTATFWKLVVDIGGLLGSQPDLGPRTLPFPFIHAPDNVLWRIIVDIFGTVGATT